MIAGNNAGYSTTRSMANGTQNSRQVLKFLIINFFFVDSYRRVGEKSSSGSKRPKSIEKKTRKLSSKLTSKRALVMMYKIANFMLPKHGERERERERVASIQHKNSSLQCLMFFSSLTQTTVKLLCRRAGESQKKCTTPERCCTAQTQGVNTKLCAAEVSKLSIFHFQCFTDSATVLLIAEARF